MISSKHTYCINDIKTQKEIVDQQLDYNDVIHWQCSIWTVRDNNYNHILHVHQVMQLEPDWSYNGRPRDSFYFVEREVSAYDVSTQSALALREIVNLLLTFKR